MIKVLFSSDQQEGTQSVVSQWFKKVGEAVTENEPLIEVSTDKVNVEIASPGTGVLSEILKKDGDEIAPGDILGSINPNASADTSKSSGVDAAKAQGQPSASALAGSASSSAANAAQELSPAVRRLLSQNNIDASKVTGTGKGGRITHDDVTAYLAGAKSGSSASHAPSNAGSSGNEALKSRKIPLNAMRRQIAQHMTQSLLHTAPHVTSVFELDLSSVMAHREKSKARFEGEGAKLTFTSYFVQACVKGIQAAPEVNSRLHEDALEVFEDINIGIATAIAPDGSPNSDSGLIVPVLRNADKLDLLGTARALHALTEKARLGQLSQAEVRGGTFTISNHGVSGSLFATPIVINQPQSAILGIGKLERRACVMQVKGAEQVVVRPKAYVTLTIDHRVLDGFKANLFLRTFVECIEGSWD